MRMFLNRMIRMITKAGYELQACGKVKCWETENKMVKPEQAEVPKSS